MCASETQSDKDYYRDDKLWRAADSCSRMNIWCPSISNNKERLSLLAGGSLSGPLGSLPVEDETSWCCRFVSRDTQTFAPMEKNVYFRYLKGVMFLLHTSLQNMVQWIKASQTHVRFRRGQLEVKSNFCRNKDISRLITTHSGSRLWATGNNRGKLVSLLLQANSRAWTFRLLTCVFTAFEWRCREESWCTLTAREMQTDLDWWMNFICMSNWFQTCTWKLKSLTGSFSLQLHHR